MAGLPITHLYMRFFRDLVLTAIVLVAVLLLLEIGLRLVGVKYEASVYTAEAERGYALRPNARGWTITENESYVRINSDGMYDREHTVARPPGVVRIAVIGSSEAEAQQVSLDKTFEAVIERQLSAELAKCGCRAEVLNFAVPGYGLAQEYLTLHDHVWRYQPQIVILATTAYTMLRNTRKLYPGPTHGSPFYIFDHGRLVPDQETSLSQPPNARGLKWRWRISNWMNSSRVLSMVNEALVNARLMVARVRAEVNFGKPSKPGSSGAIPADYISTWPYDPMRPEMRESWVIGNEFFKMMKQDCDEHSAEFWIVTIEMEGEVSPKLSDRKALQERINVSSLLLSDQYIEKLAHDDDIRVITLAPPMGDFALSHQVALHGFFNTAFNDGHWNETGHEVAGCVIAQNLLKGSDALNGRSANRIVTSSMRPPGHDPGLCACGNK